MKIRVVCWNHFTREARDCTSDPDRLQYVCTLLMRKRARNVTRRAPGKSATYACRESVMHQAKVVHEHRGGLDPTKIPEKLPTRQRFFFHPLMLPGPELPQIAENASDSHPTGAIVPFVRPPHLIPPESDGGNGDVANMQIVFVTNPDVFFGDLSIVEADFSSSTLMLGNGKAEQKNESGGKSGLSIYMYHRNKYVKAARAARSRPFTDGSLTYAAKPL